MEMDLNLSSVEPQMLDLAKEALAENDILKVMGYMPNTRRMVFVIDNYLELKQRGVYEEALLDAYIGTRLNFSSLNRIIFTIGQGRRPNPFLPLARGG